MNKELYLADESMRLLLQHAYWFCLYGLMLLLTVAAGPCLFQIAGGAATLTAAFRCARTALQLYRVNKVMRDINQ